MPVYKPVDNLYFFYFSPKTVMEKFSTNFL